MNNKRKFLRRNFALYYLIFVVIVLLFLFFVMFFTVVDSAPVTTPISNITTITEEVGPVSISGKSNLRINFSEWNKTCDWKLVVINGSNPVSQDFKPQLKACRDTSVDCRITSDLEEMIRAAGRNNIKLWLSSGYRSLEKQDILFKKKVSKYLAKGYGQADAENLAQGVVARPGRSEHHTGLAVDLNGVRDDFCHTKTYKWLMKNASNYGFVLRYQGEKQNITGVIYEPWHFRYVGEKNAKEMQLKNMCLEEYVSYLMSKN